MKWNDKYLNYSGEYKSIIYNYIHSVIKRILLEKKKQHLNNVFIINFILNDKNWDKNIFQSKEKHDWFINELKNNPYLFDFVNSEITKILELPNIYDYSYLRDLTDLDEIKSDLFSKIVQKYIIENPNMPHYYFSSLDYEEIKQETDDYVKKNFRKFNCRRIVLSMRYEKLLKIQKLLDRELNIKSEIVPIGRSTITLKSIDNSFNINVARWGSFPIVEQNPQKMELFCIADEISVYVFGFANAENIKKKIDDKFLFFKEKPENFKSLTAFYGFEKSIFNKDVGNIVFSNF